METIQSENEIEEIKTDTSLDTSNSDISDISDNASDVSDLNNNSLEKGSEESNEASKNRIEDILKFRDNLLAREILSSGVGKSDKIVHFGAGYRNSLVWEYLASIKTQNLVEDVQLMYTAVDIDHDKLDFISKLNLDNNIGIDVRTVNNTMQGFIDNNTDEFDWSIITGIFDKNLYKENQFEFIDKIVSSLLPISREGVIFTFDSFIENDEEYKIEHIMNYVSSLYNRYRINRINEQDYIICVYKYYHSIIP